MTKNQIDHFATLIIAEFDKTGTYITKDIKRAITNKITDELEKMNKETSVKLIDSNTGNIDDGFYMYCNDNEELILKVVRNNVSKLAITNQETCSQLLVLTYASRFMSYIPNVNRNVFSEYIQMIDALLKKHGF